MLIIIEIEEIGNRNKKNKIKYKLAYYLGILYLI